MYFRVIFIIIHQDFLSKVHMVYILRFRSAAMKLQTCVLIVFVRERRVRELMMQIWMRGWG